MFCLTNVSLEGREYAEIIVLKTIYLLAIDCDLLSVPQCIEYRDNATSVPRWLGVFGQFYSFINNKCKKLTSLKLGVWTT